MIVALLLLAVIVRSAICLALYCPVAPVVIADDEPETGRFV
jgi:hypothetical protein